MTIHSHWMCHALNLAKKAGENAEVPVGAVLIHQQKILAEGWNQPISLCDPTAHAEIVALRQAAKTLQNYRLPEGCTLYVTLEPCVMCVGALLHARLSYLVYGALDPKAGAVSSQFHLLDCKRFNHAIEWDCGCLADECLQLLQSFFRKRRR